MNYETVGPARGRRIDLSREFDFTAGNAHVRPSLCEIEIGGETEAIEPRVMQVLVALGTEPEAVISRDDLCRTCWEGRVVSNDAIHRCIAAVRRLGERGRFTIETIPRVGYRLKVLGGPSIESQSPPPETEVGYKFVPRSDLQSEGGASPGHGGHEFTPAPFALPDKPSIAVLPFQDLNGDPEQEYFADGVTEDIITALSRFRELLVMSRGSSFAFKGKSLTVRQIAQYLGVRYVLSGSMRKVSGRIRVTAELTDAENGMQIWTERYDRDLIDIFDLQDELGRTVTAVVQPAVRGAEIERARQKPPADLSAYDLYLRALPHLWAATRDEIPKAIQLLQQSVSVDATSAPSLAALAWCLIWASPAGADASLRTRVEALSLARSAVDQDTNDAFAQAVLGIVLSMSDEHDLALLHAKEAVRLNPSLAFAWGTMGMVSTWCGDFEGAIKNLDRAIGLSPYDTLLYVWMTWLTSAYFALRRYEEGIAWARRAIQQNPNFGTAHRLLAANLVLAERLDDARDVTRKRDAVQKTTIGELRAMRLFQQEEVIERYLSAQRMVGVSE